MKHLLHFINIVLGIAAMTSAHARPICTETALLRP